MTAAPDLDSPQHGRLATRAPRNTGTPQSPTMPDTLPDSTSPQTSRLTHFTLSAKNTARVAGERFCRRDPNCKF